MLHDTDTSSPLDRLDQIQAHDHARDTRHPSLQDKLDRCMSMTTVARVIMVMAIPLLPTSPENLSQRSNGILLSNFRIRPSLAMMNGLSEEDHLETGPRTRASLFPTRKKTLPPGMQMLA